MGNASNVAAALFTVAIAAAQPVSYQREVAPLLAERCSACHQPGNAAAGFVATTPLSVARVANSGLLLATVTGEKPRMPKAGQPLTPAEVAVLTRWVAQGAQDDSGGKQELWWSLRPLPKLEPATLDSFIQKKLRDANLTASPPADPRTLVRRVYLDLHGLPPTPEQTAAFFADPRPDAYEHLVDQLLASPRYGERWARHWLDIVHYGDSHAG